MLHFVVYNVKPDESVGWRNRVNDLIKSATAMVPELELHPNVVTVSIPYDPSVSPDDPGLAITVIGELLEKPQAAFALRLVLAKRVCEAVGSMFPSRRIQTVIRGIDPKQHGYWLA